MADRRLKITNEPIKHLLYENANKTFGGMCSKAGVGQVVALVGPTQAGKSMVFSQIMPRIQVQLSSGQNPAAIPMVSLQLETAEEGRIKGRWLCLQLLKLLKHPMYQHIGDLDELDHYIPSRGRDEGSLRNAVKQALNSRGTTRVALDEAHLLTRSKLSEFRGHIMESLKSIAAVERTAYLCGGYELATMGLFDHPHFAGRTVTVDFGNYEDSDEHRHEWRRILASFGRYLPLESDDLLFKMADQTMELSNGCVGLLEKWLWTAWVLAESTGVKISSRLMERAAPSQKEFEVIRKDIVAGRQALRNATNVQVETGLSTAIGLPDTATKPATGKVRRPFERNPARLEMGKIEVFED